MTGKSTEYKVFTQEGKGYASKLPVCSETAHTNSKDSLIIRSLFV
jgi:hypothetical protein